MSTILILISILFLLKLLRDSLFYVWLWQVKEYRMDRMMSHLKENVFPCNKRGWGIIIAVIIFLSYFIFLENHSLLFQYLVLAFFGLAFLGIIKEIKGRSLKRPKLTLKIALVFSIMVVFYILLFAIYWIPAFAGMTRAKVVEMIEFLLFIIIINPLIISLIVLAIEPIFYFQKKRIIKRATRKMANLKKVKTIGITGSYGKTSTKEFLSAILSQKYKVVKTEGNNNTNIGVAYTVLNKVSDEYDYFICEMGAYKIGEIKEMCEIVKPSIGILTGINQQHIDLFGSQENIVKAKFELIEALPENGLAIINKSIKYPMPTGRQEVSNIKAKNTKYFSLDNVENIKVWRDYAEFEYVSANNYCHPEFSSGSINDLGLVSFNSPKSRSNRVGEHGDNSQKILKQVQNDKNSLKFRLNLLGKHYIENVLSGIMVAEHLGMSLGEIKNAVEKIRPNKFMMRKAEGLNNSIFIDDSYSANYDGVLAALDYLNEAYSDYKKIIVFPGIIELGKESEEAHRILFDRIGEICDAAYILGIKNYELRIMNKECKFVFEKDFSRVADMLKKDLMLPLISNPPTPLIRGANIVVLFESRGAGAVMNKLGFTNTYAKRDSES